MKTAEKGLQDLQQFVDTLIVIPNQNLFRIANERTTFADAFKMADDVLHAGVRGVTDLMIMPGLINLDFADIRTVMSEMGKAMMGTGEASGEDRAVKAAEAAIANPLLDHSSMRGARGVLINITGGADMTLFEVDTAANRIRTEVGDSEANIIFGSTFNPELNGIIRVSVVATGIDADQMIQTKIQSNIEAEKEIEIIENQEPAFILAEEIPSFDNYTTANVQSVDQQVQNFNSITSTERSEEQKPVSNRTSLFSKMWNSIKSTDKTTIPRVIESNKIISSQRHSGEMDIRDVPAFLRKQNKNSDQE